MGHIETKFKFFHEAVKELQNNLKRGHFELIFNPDDINVLELEEGEKLCTSADSRLAASSKLVRVRVLGSKNRLVISRPWRAGRRRAPATGRARKRWASSRTVAKSATEKDARSSTWRWLQPLKASCSRRTIQP